MLRNDVIMTANVFTAHYVTCSHSQHLMHVKLMLLLSSSAQISASNYRLMATSTGLGLLLLLAVALHRTVSY